MYYCIQGTWVWTDGTILDYTNWYPEQPGGGTAQNCMLMYSNDDYYFRWNDVSCTYTDPIVSYVCKL
jgi:hypothetical protein